MKMTGPRRILCAGLLVLAAMQLAACETTGETPFGQACETSADCVSDVCVGGEAGTGRAPFCSDDCAGKQTGDVCGEGQGKCIADFVSWCWKPCETDNECAAFNPERPTCAVTSSSGVDSPFKVCLGVPK
jgi:hypothetical protein